MKKSLLLVVVTFMAVAVMIGDSRFNREIAGEEAGFGVSRLLEEDTYAGEDVVNILLLGLDRRSKSEPSRSDSMIVLTIDRKNQSVKAASLMRDMYVSIPGKPGNKINSAYTYGGGLLAIETVNSSFGLNIRDFVAVDFFGFEDIIDRLGGVEINVKEQEVPHCLVDKAGFQRLNGKQALEYSRIRKVGNSDFERTERQRRVLNEVFKRIRAEDSGKLPALIKELLPHVETSLNLKELVNLASDASRFKDGKLEELRIPIPGGFADEKINGASCLVPDLEKNRETLRRFIYGGEAD